MDARPAYDYLFISDLHLGAGYDPGTQTFDRLEDFFYDEAFFRFICHYIDVGRKRPHRRWTLVVLGDFVEFLQVPYDLSKEDGYSSTTSAHSVLKLANVASGHFKVFEALAAFVAHGHRLQIVAGNHDVEFVYEGVQQEFVTWVSKGFASLKERNDPLLPEAADPPDFSRGIQFFEWFVYERGLFYAEHGHQYDETNSFVTQVKPFTSDDPVQIDLPIGSCFVLDVFNKVEWLDPYADNMKPLGRYLAWTFRRRPLTAVIVTATTARTYFSRLLKNSPPSNEEKKDARAEYQRQWLDGYYAAKVNMPPSGVRNIDNLARIPPTRNKLAQFLRGSPELGKIANAAIIGLGLVIWLFILSTIVSSVLWLVDRISGDDSKDFGDWFGPVLRWGIYVLIALVGLLVIVRLVDHCRQIWKDSRDPRAKQVNTHPALYVAAHCIHTVLTRTATGEKESKNLAVKTYIFGHNHAAEQIPLDATGQPPMYFNCGTWTPVIPSGTEILGEREMFTFVAIEDGVPSLRLWHDIAGRDEPLRLQGQGRWHKLAPIPEGACERTAPKPSPATAASSPPAGRPGE